MSKTGTTKTLKTNSIEMCNGTAWVPEKVSFNMWNGSAWVAVPADMYNGSGNSYTTLNEGKYQTTWYADWSETYADLERAESHKDHGNKRNRPPSSLQRQKGSHFMYQGWWSSDPHGRMAGLMGFREDLIKEKLKDATIEKIELYIRNVHSYYSTGQTAHLYWHNFTAKPASIKKSTSFPTANKLGAWKFYRGASVQRTDSPATAKVDWNTGYGTGLAEYNQPNVSIEGNNNGKKVWIILDNSIGEKFKNGQASGFGIYEPAANSQGQSYGYWCGSELTVQQYKDMEKVNRINGFNVNVSWMPQLRITYKKLNG